LEQQRKDKELKNQQAVEVIWICKTCEDYLLMRTRIFRSAKSVRRS